MRKYLILVLVVAFAGFTINCNTRTVPQGAFRVKTRAKIHLFGVPIPISIPNPGLSVNLKLTATPSPGTYAGTVSEYNPGGGFISTDSGGIYDATDAILPAVWNAKIAPSQSRCSAPVSNPFSFSASNGSSHKLNCKWNININFLVQPSAVHVGFGEVPEGFVHASTSSPSNSLTGVTNQQFPPEDTYRRYSASELKAYYYRQVSGEDYVLDGQKNIISISSDGSSVVIPVPNYTSHQGIHHYKILVKEVGSGEETYVSHGEMDVSYPFRRNCPGGGNTCQ